MEIKIPTNETHKYRRIDTMTLKLMVDNGQTFSMNVPNGTVHDFVQRISHQLARSKAPDPIVISLSSPKVETEIATIENKVMNSSGFPLEFKEQYPEYYIWVNPDVIVEKGLVSQLTRITKYSRCIFIFDHQVDDRTSPQPVKDALGAECSLHINFDSNKE